MFFVQLILNFVGTFNMRSTVMADYFWTGVTDVIIALLYFFIIVQIVDNGNRKAKIIGFILGALTGSLGGIYISKLILNG